MTFFAQVFLLAQNLHVGLKRKKSAKKVSQVGCAQLLVQYFRYWQSEICTVVEFYAKGRYNLSIALLTMLKLS